MDLLLDTALRVVSICVNCRPLRFGFLCVNFPMLYLYSVKRNRNSCGLIYLIYWNISHGLLRYSFFWPVTVKRASVQQHMLILYLGEKNFTLVVCHLLHTSCIPRTHDCSGPECLNAPGRIHWCTGDWIAQRNFVDGKELKWHYEVDIMSW